MAAIKTLNPKAEVARAAQALSINISGARGIQDVLRTNLGPKGTMKMLVSGAGDIKITKDGNILLHEMQIQHPTASMISKACTAQDDIIGDGTTSTVLLIGEMLKQADIQIQDGLHPRLIAEGFDLAKVKAQEVLDQVKIVDEMKRERLCQVARTALRTKVQSDLADKLTEVCVDAVLSIKEEGKPLDLHMVEIVEMQHKTEMDTQLVKGLVLDHGGRHPDMPKRATNAYILTCNVSMEYEKTEVNSGFFYKSAGERDKLVTAEREFIENRVNKVIELKKKVCAGNNNTFVVINQKGIDPMSLDMLAKEGIMGMRRAKRRNMERLALACGGMAVNSFDDMTEDCLGFAGSVYEHVLGETKYTFVEELKNPHSVTILIKGPYKHALQQTKDATRDGLRGIKNALDDGSLIAAYAALMKYENEVKGRARYGVRAFADALLVIPKTLASNSGYDAMDSLVKLREEYKNNGGLPVGLDITTGEALNPCDAGIFDNYCVKRHMLDACSVIARNLLIVDEIMRAGLSQLK
ncbi:T-complex protein 1 subunit zeta-like [Homarus americanus]|uniref:T-complex protein 1 subunit zeta-like n=1 Tax=Homarus americanus TaxID=6706 RepID=A0A8J5J9T6_HOMAM|nr:T-complex protein 1 subunit zeta-like [Homarus americanus]